MKNIFLICFFFNSFFLFSLQWPVENPVVAANFGERSGNYYNAGIKVTGESTNVYAVDRGEVVFYQRENNHFSALPSGLGNFIAIEHDMLLRTIYGHLADDFIGEKKTNVVAGEVIGEIGNSGSGNGRYLYLELVDMELRELINPFLLLPAIDDRSRPVIRDLFIKESGAESYQVLANNAGITTGKYDLSAIVYDIAENISNTHQLAPYSIRMYINGREFSSIIYNSIKKSGDYLVLSSNNRSVNDYYIGNENWQVYLGRFDFETDVSVIRIVVSDFRNNESTREFRITSQR